MQSLHNLDFLTLLHAGHGVHHGDWNFPSVYSPFARLYLCDGGEAHTQIGETVIDLKPGHLYLMPPYTMYSDWSTGYFSHYYIHVYERVEMGQLSIFELMDIPYEIQATDFDVECFKRIVECNGQRTLPPPLSNPKVYDNQETLVGILHKSRMLPLQQIAETNGLLLFLLSEFLKHSAVSRQPEDERIRETVKYIREHQDERLTVGELAKHCYLSEDHFGRLFKKEMNCSPTDYIQRKKIETAQIMLAVKSMSVKDIAYTLAFQNVSYFNRIFKKLTGSTPQKYRREINK